jgi:hypothetical protein
MPWSSTYGLGKAGVALIWFKGDYAFVFEKNYRLVVPYSCCSIIALLQQIYFLKIPAKHFAPLNGWFWTLNFYHIVLRTSTV